MTTAIHLVFDDCLSKRAIQALQTIASFSKGKVHVAHLADFSLSGQRDDDWIPTFKEQSWIVVTTDRGKSNKGGKLPILCRRYAVTHIMMSGAVHGRNQFDKLRAIFDVWPDIVAAAAAQPGTGYMLKVHNSGGDRVELVRSVDPLGADETPKIQQSIDYHDE